MSPAETLNHAAANLQSLTEAKTKTENNLQRLNAEVDRELAAFARANAERDLAIEASVADPDTRIPNADRSTLDLAERKLAAAKRAYEQALHFEHLAVKDLAAAKTAFEIDQARESAKQLYAAVLALKSFGAFLAFQESDQVRETLHAEGYRLSRAAESGAVVLHIPCPRNVPSMATAAANSLNPRAHPAAAKHYRALVESEQAQGQRDRDVAAREREQREAAELAQLERRHASDMATAGMVQKAALQARYLKDLAKIKTSHLL